MLDRDKKKQFALRTDQLSDELYDFINEQINKYGSFKNYVENIAEEDRKDKLGKQFIQFKRELTQEISSDLKDELANLKHFIQEQFNMRSLTKTHDPSHQDKDHKLQNEKTQQVYDINKLKVTGKIEEKTDVDF